MIACERQAGLSITFRLKVIDNKSCGAVVNDKAGGST